MIITGLYIVKNEEYEIRRSIKSIMRICDEIIVVDTGSEDGTVECAQALGAKVFHFDWINDFSAARNFALSKANGDLIIFIDADEWFPKALGKADREYLEQLVDEGHKVFSVLRSNISNGMLSQPVYNTRMLRGKIGLHYIGAIHETLSEADDTVYLPERFLLHHSGYDGSLSAEKSERNLRLLSEQLEKATDPVLKVASAFYLIRENRILKKYEQSLKYVTTFFELWTRMKKKDRPINVGISAHDVIGKLYTELGEEVIPNDVFFAFCQSFIREYPKHPAAYYALLSYYYARHRNYDFALEAIARIEALAENYNIEDFPHDYVGADEPRINALMLKGNIFFDRAERELAFDCYASILKNANPTGEFLRRLLSLIKAQPTDDVVDFLSAMPKEMNLEYIELLLSQLIYFPSLKSVYMYFAVQHLKITKKHSYVSAIAALISGDSYDLVVDVAKYIREEDPVTAGELFILAAIYSDEEDIKKQVEFFPETVKILESFFSETSPDTLNKLDIALIRQALTVILFLGNEDIQRRFIAVVSEFSFIFAHIALGYCNSSGEYEKLIPHINVDPERLDSKNRAAFFRLMGRAYTSLRQYDRAKSYLIESFELLPSDLATYKDLRILASVVPEYSQEITSLISRFRAASGVRTARDESISAAELGSRR